MAHLHHLVSAYTVHIPLSHQILAGFLPWSFLKQKIEGPFTVEAGSHFLHKRPVDVDDMKCSSPYLRYCKGLCLIRYSIRNTTNTTLPVGCEAIGF